MLNWPAIFTSRKCFKGPQNSIFFGQTFNNKKLMDKNNVN